MAKKRTLQEIEADIDALELEDQLAVYYSTKVKIDAKQTYIVDQLKKIEDNNAKMNGK